MPQEPSADHARIRRDKAQSKGFQRCIYLFKAPDVQKHSVASPTVITRYKKTITALRRQQGSINDVIAEYGNKDIELLKSVSGIGEFASKTTYSAISRFKRTK